jgi:hypothetical protein
MGSRGISFLAASAVVDVMVDSAEGGERSVVWGWFSMVTPKVTGSCFSFAAIVTLTMVFHAGRARTVFGAGALVVRRSARSLQMPWSAALARRATYASRGGFTAGGA